MHFNIFFAFTPLHLKIINSIPKNNPSILVVLNKKKLEEFCYSYINKKEYIDIYIFKSLFFNPINLLKIRYKYKNIYKVFVGNYKFFNFRLIQFFLNYSKLVTFDDGIGGITESYFNLENNSLKENIYKILKIDIRSIMRNHEFHYSIYQAHGEIFKKNIKTLKLAGISKEFDYDGNVLITTDKSEVGTMSKENEYDLFKKIVESLNIKYVIHHPAKRFNIKIDNTFIISEPYLSEDIVNHSKFNKVYSLSASTVLGIAQLKRFPEKNITYLANKGASTMSVLTSNTNINTINFEDL